MGLKLGVLSNSDGRAPALLDRLGLKGFDAVIDSALVGVAKPDPGIFSLAQAGTGTQPEEMVYVGDVPWLDGAGSLAAGCSAIIYDPLNLFERDCLELTAIHGREVFRVASLLQIRSLVVP